jgi:acyl-CoA synthetase (AMP-forming)/AMP-acid ligase II
MNESERSAAVSGVGRRADEVGCADRGDGQRTGRDASERKAMQPTVPELLRARADEQPDRIAIRLPDGRGLTFRRWEERSTAVAHGLVARGVRRGDRVGLRFDGTGWIEYAVGYLAVQKAGGVAVPLSAKLAERELREVLAHCGAAGLVTAEPAADPDRWCTTVDELAAGDRAPLDLPVSDVPVGPDDLAQIVYTSGTTGRPKGVAANHANVTYGFPPRPRRRRFAHSEVFLHAFPIGTNGAQTMLLYALAAHPAALAMPRYDSAGCAALVAAHRVGTLFLVPSMAIDLLDSGAYLRHDRSSVRLVGSSAAALPPAVARSLAAAFPRATVVNLYSSTESGPAETTMVVDPERPGSLGRPADPGDLWVADEAGRPLPPGEVGEVWLRSPAAPRAYYRDPDATAATFRAGWVRMGDLGYLDDDGYLFLVDRDRDVIKSGGLKVSTLQVEAALHEHAAVAEAAVLGIPHEVLGSAVGAAVVLRSPASVAELRDFLKPRLARHEIPTRLLVLDSLPHNDVGKVVKRELRDLFTVRPAQRPAAPLRTEAEVALGKLWTEVLGVGSVGADDDFFALGGESLKATQLATVASETFGVAATVALVFDEPVLAGQAAWLAAQRARHGAPAGSEGGQPLGSTQEYFLHWMHATPRRRQIQPVSVALRVRDALDVAVLERALNVLVRRHEMLRATFHRDGAGFAVDIRSELPVQVSTVDSSGGAPAEREARARELARHEVERPYDLDQGPLLRATVIRLGPDDQVLVLVVEHLAFDGMSFAVLLRELGLVYSALRLGRPYELPPLPLTASELFTRARTGWAASAAFWRERLAGAPRSLPHLPGHDPDAVRYVGRSLEFEVPVEAAQALRDLARTHRATTFMATLAAWCAVLRDWTGAGDIVVQTPVTGRTHLEDESVVGCVVQLLMIRVPAAGAEDLDELLRRVRARVIEAADHQVHRFLDVAAAVPYPVHFFFESWGGPAHLPGLDSHPFPLPPELCLAWPFADGDPDLSAPRLSLVEQPDGAISGRLLYNTEAYARQTVAELAERYLSYIETYRERRRP